MRAARTLLAAAAAVALASSGAGAQNLGPFRQFLAIEPTYTRMQLDAGSGNDRVGTNAYGARLWVNLAPFSGPGWNVLGYGSLGLFYSYAPDQGNHGFTIAHYGAEYDQFLVHRPLGGVIDPFVSVGAGAFRVNDFTAASPVTKLALTPGVGVRIPLPNRFQLRADAKDAFVKQATGTGGSAYAKHWMFGGSLGITF